MCQQTCRIRESYYPSQLFFHAHYRAFDTVMRFENYESKANLVEEKNKTFSVIKFI